MQPSNYTKEIVAKLMLSRGHSFLVSAILLNRHGGSHEVELYNICQGIEVTLKGFLLLKNYNKYKPLLPKLKYFGHDLVKLSDAATQEYGLKPLASESKKELDELNIYYTNHYLRYSGAHDLLFPSTDLEYGAVVKRLFAAIKLTNRKLGV